MNQLSSQLSIPLIDHRAPPFADQPRSRISPVAFWTTSLILSQDVHYENSIYEPFNRYLSSVGPSPATSENSKRPSQDAQQYGSDFLDSSKSIPIAAQDNVLQSFLFAPFSQKNCGEANKYAFLTFSLASYSHTEHGTLYKCGDFSQIFSKVVFFGRSTMFKQIAPDAKWDNKGFYE